MTHVITRESERTRLTDGFEFFVTLEPNPSFQMQMLKNGTNLVYRKTTENKKFESGLLSPMAMKHMH